MRLSQLAVLTALLSSSSAFAATRADLRSRADQLDTRADAVRDAARGAPNQGVLVRGQARVGVLVNGGVNAGAGTITRHGRTSPAISVGVRAGYGIGASVGVEKTRYVGARRGVPGGIVHQDSHGGAFIGGYSSTQTNKHGADAVRSGLVGVEIVGGEVAEANLAVRLPVSWPSKDTRAANFTRRKVEAVRKKLAGDGDLSATQAEAVESLLDRAHTRLSVAEQRLGIEAK